MNLPASEVEEDGPWKGNRKSRRAFFAKLKKANRKSRRAEIRKASRPAREDLPNREVG